jgi:hypothetical protein
MAGVLGTEQFMCRNKNAKGAKESMVVEQVKVKGSCGSNKMCNF